MNQLTKIVLAFELYEQGVPVSHIAAKVGVNRGTIYRWINGITASSLEVFLESYLVAKKGSRAKRKIDPLIKSWIYEYRENYQDVCGQKIGFFLKKEKGLFLSTTTIYKVLRERYKLRSRWKKNQVRGSVPQAFKPREVIQMDTVDFGSIFAFTAVDIFSREVDVALRPSLTAKDGQEFLRICMGRRFEGFSKLIQTDGGSEFKAEFRREVFNYCIRHRYARPYKKNEQAYIESFNRSLRKECLGWGKYKTKDLPHLQKEVGEYLVYYHNKRPHLGIGMKTPTQYLREYRLLHI